MTRSQNAHPCGLQVGRQFPTQGLGHKARGLSCQMRDMPLLFFFFNFLFNVYSFLKDRDRQSTSRGGVEREGDTESEQAPDPKLSAQGPTRGSNSRTARS